MNDLIKKMELDEAQDAAFRADIAGRRLGKEQAVTHARNMNETQGSLLLPSKSERTQRVFSENPELLNWDPPAPAPAPAPAQRLNSRIDGFT